MLPANTIDLLNSGEYVAAALPPSDGLRRWIAVFPFKVDPENGVLTLGINSEPWKFRIWCVGLALEFDYENFDLHEEYLTTFEDLVVNDLATVEATVSRWLADLERLAEPRKCACPI